MKELKVKLGDKVAEGSVIAVIEAAGAGAAAAPAPAPAAPPQHRTRAGRRRRRWQPPASAGGGSVEVRVPDIGDFKDVAVIEVLVKPGDTVKVEQSLITVESDKASMEIPSSAAGVIKDLKVKVGDKVNVGDLVAVLQGWRRREPGTAGLGREGSAGAGRRAPRAPADRTPPTAALPPHEPTSPTGTLPHASPSVRKFARELGVPLEEVKGTGPKGRITQEDVQGFTKAVMSGEARTKAAAAKAPAGGGGEAPGPAALAQGRLRQVRRRSSARRCRASRRSAPPTCTATG